MGPRSVHLEDVPLRAWLLPFIAAPSSPRCIPVQLQGVRAFFLNLTTPSNISNGNPEVAKRPTFLQEEIISCHNREIKSTHSQERNEEQTFLLLEPHMYKVLTGSKRLLFLYILSVCVCVCVCEHAPDSAQV